MARALSILSANAREAIDSLRKARLRTALGMVGIMVGISSVIAMVSLGEIAKNQVRKEFEDLGTNILIIRESYESQSTEAELITLRDAVLLDRTVSSITASAPRVSGYKQFNHSGKKVGDGNVQGVTESFLPVNKLSLQSGRFVSNFDINRFFCVIGSDIADKIRQNGISNPIGTIIQIDEWLFTIIGILNFKQESYTLPVQIEAGRSVFIPITTAKRIFPNSKIDSIIARFTPDIDYKIAVSDVQDYFQQRSPSLVLEITTAKEIIAQMESQMGIFSLLLGSVGSISLIVGGIGIMNIMLVSVAERRREIAIRRALGARGRDIQSQFMIESIILTMAGGVLGILLGLMATWGICQFTSWEFMISGISVASGLGTAAAAGIFFGFQPAYQASKLDPIAGLQNE